jgi:peroxiredoxin
MRNDFYDLPANLPVPQDDGACDHLEGMRLPALNLSSTAGGTVNLAMITQGPTVLFFYPRTGRPDEPAPVGWDEIPGARGCTPQSCGFRDLKNEFEALGVQVLGVSTQDTDFHREFIERMHIPFAFLSDKDLALTRALRLPTFIYGGMELLRRMAWYCEGGVIQKVFYPVFPPNRNAETVLGWIRGR